MNNEGMFRELIENSDDIIVVAGPDFRIRYVSSSVARLFGIEPFSLVGEDIFAFVSPDKVEHWKACLNRSSDVPFREEVSLRTSREGKVYFDVEVSKLIGQPDISGVVLKLHDISDKKSRERELIRSNQQLDQVIYKTTHDLKAPLMSAMGLVSLAENASPEQKSNYISLIKKSLLKLNAYIEEMNHLFRNDKLAVRRERISIEDLLREELTNIRNLYEASRLDIRFEILSEKEFYSDSVRLKSIVANVLSNAIKYSDPRKNEPFVQISVRVNPEMCELCFRDNGIGIDAQFHDKIFDLFFRATDHSQGTGIGLFIVKDTVEKLRGSITVESVSGEGSTFIIRIPNQIYQPIEVE